jgi:putative transposase
MNALAESIIGLFKTEVIRRGGPWRGIDGVEFATREWVDWFNHRRLLEPIGYVPPAEAEAHYYAAKGILPLAA